MTIFKCKMCAGALEVTEGQTVCECEYCGTKQTVSIVDDEKIIKMYDRANRLRMASEFDKAASVYEGIIEESDTEAEAYWGLLLCKYGIEYVDDPATGDKIPTCHRSSFESIMDDSDFEMVMENADTLSKTVYRQQAKQIEELRLGIIELSGKEAPYDIFICYKETDENGDRTIDSVIAQDVYEALTDRGYRVFFSRISLEDKLGTEYEPYIFAALHSAKVMLAFGTSYDYYNAVWVKNEWSRFLKIMAKDKGKYLIPCFKDIDAYDMPKEFAKLQAQDMGKVGAIQDLVRGIDKLTGKNASKEQEKASAPGQVIQQVVQTVGGTNADALIQRGYLALEDGEWKKADGFFEEALNHNAQSAEAYLGKLMVELKVSHKEELGKVEDSFESSGNYQKAMRFASGEIKKLLEEAILAIANRKEEEKRIEEEGKEQEYKKALALLGLGPDPKLQSDVDQENKRHEEIIQKLQSELRQAEEIAHQKEIEIAPTISKTKEQATSEYEMQRQKLQNELAQMRAKNAASIQEKEKELASLGIFARKRIRELSESISEELRQHEKEEGVLQEKLDEVKKIYRAQIAEADQKLAIIHQEESRIQKEIATETEKHKQLMKQYMSKTIDKKSARKKFEELGDYKDSKSLIIRCCLSKEDTIQFGSYQWRVLEVEKNRALLIADKAVCSMYYHLRHEEVTWETCTLRKWLNNEFYNTFSTKERSKIMISHLENKDNPKYGTRGGNPTEDKVFLLSLDEVNKYFPLNSDRQGIRYYGTVDWWWLRTPGYNHFAALEVWEDGSISDGGYGVFKGEGAVRPAMWISLE